MSQKEREAMQAALNDLSAENYVRAILFFRAALAQPEQESVGIVGTMPGTGGGFTMACFKASDVPVGTAIYTHPEPAQREPVEPEAIEAIHAALDALKQLNNWLVCSAISSADDMAQSFPAMQELTEKTIISLKAVHQKKPIAHTNNYVLPKF